MKCIAAVVMMAVALAVAEGSLAPSDSHPLGTYFVPPNTVVQDNSHHRLYRVFQDNLNGRLLRVFQHNLYPRFYTVPWGFPLSRIGMDDYYPNAQNGARYLAATPSKIHEAPLPGHAINQVSLNLDPAPGTL